MDDSNDLLKVVEDHLLAETEKLRDENGKIRRDHFYHMLQKESRFVVNLIQLVGATSEPNPQRRRLRGSLMGVFAVLFFMGVVALLFLC